MINSSANILNIIATSGRHLCLNHSVVSIYLSQDQGVILFTCSTCFQPRVNISLVVHYGLPRSNRNDDSGFSISIYFHKTDLPENMPVVFRLSFPTPLSLFYFYTLLRKGISLIHSRCYYEHWPGMEKLLGSHQGGAWECWCWYWESEWLQWLVAKHFATQIVSILLPLKLKEAL